MYPTEQSWAWTTSLGLGWYPDTLRVYVADRIHLSARLAELQGAQTLLEGMHDTGMQIPNWDRRTGADGYLQFPQNWFNPRDWPDHCLLKMGTQLFFFFDNQLFIFPASEKTLCSPLLRVDYRSQLRARCRAINIIA